MTIFSGVVSDLEEATLYELDALDFVRTTLFTQTEQPDTCAVIDLSSSKSPEGQYPSEIRRVIAMSMSDQPVRDALSRLRPLAFAATFKVQDMIAEWILHANGSAAWAFSRKLKDYDAARAGGGLQEPTLFAGWPELSKGFWELYRALIPFRGTLVHASGFSVKSDGTLEISKGSNNLSLSHDMQGGYIRALCLLTRHLLAGSTLVGVPAVLVENDFAALDPVHGQSGFTARRFRLEALKVLVPPQAARSMQPFDATIDFGLLKVQMDSTYPVGTGGVLLYQLTIVAKDDKRTLLWTFPPDLVPTAEITLKEGDPAFDRFLTIRTN
jgi:hypothetical protein